MGEVLGHYKGFIVENFVAQELFCQTHGDLISWGEGTAEVEFLKTSGKGILPIEVKSSARFSRTKSLDSFITKYSPEVAYKLSPQNRGYDPRRRMLTLPVYLAGKIV